MARLKELHLATKFEDLDKHCAIPDVRAKKTQKLLETARILYQEAEKYYRDGDEEFAYVYYMRYFKLLQNIHDKPDYGLYKQIVRQKLGDNRKNKITMDKLELLNKSLEERYSRLSDTKQDTDRKSSMNASYANERDYGTLNSLNANEKFDRVKADTVLASPKGELSAKPLNIISCKELFDRMKENNVLIMDCRSGADYQMSHLTYSWAFNVPEEHIVAGMSAGKLQGKLDEKTKALWSARSVKDHVVLMDWNCRDANPADETHIAVLMNILKNWDPDVTYRSPIKILDGGYEYFIMVYPHLCTNPIVQAPQKRSYDIDLLDEIEYPSINDITMKDEVRERIYSSSPTGGRVSISDIPTTSAQVTRPSIDRSSKLAAIKTYDEKQKTIVQIKREQEELMEKAQTNDEQLDLAYKKLNDSIEQKESEEFAPEVQQLFHNIMQLETSALDNKIEIHRLRDELNKFKLDIDSQQEKLSDNELENLDEAIRKIELKIKERQILDEQHEREKQQRERQLALARENKRHMKPPVLDDEEVSKPKIPQVDRTVKPQLNAVPPTVPTHAYPVRDRRRDFSPVSGSVRRGLTGLKNLGNTCYMNSILQCLSHTPQLAEYCITDQYKNFISRSNKTKGQVIEEVAALIKVLWNGNFKCVASKDLRYVVGQYEHIFRGIDQQDSHEFLTILMDWLHSDLQTLKAPERPRNVLTPSEKAWLEFTKARESLILHLFYGQIKSTVKCRQCEKESATYECFSNLSLELPSNADFCHLNQCMDMYFSGELIDGWNCPNCKQKRVAIKTLKVSKLPWVLVIHLKRFHADSSGIGNAYKKKQNYVNFPLENLDMTPHVARSELRSTTPKSYQLYGVSNHYGSMESGHYTAYCKSGNNTDWFKFDDQVVTPLSPSNVVSSGAYILFYTRLPPIQISDSGN